MRFYKIVITTCLFFLCYTSKAQYGNEWIDVNSSYIRIKTYQNGIYYLTKQTLVNEGMPSNINPETIRLFHRGLEQQILISDKGDGSFDTNDTLYFYGQRNDGTLDSALYRKSTHQPHRFLNLHSDTSVYFLNWGGNVSTARMSTPNLTSSTSQLFHREQISKYFHQTYAFGPEFGLTRSSGFDIGEGWCSEIIFESFTFILEGIHDALPTNFNPTLELQVVGRNYYPMDRKVVLKIGNPLSPDFVDTLEGFKEYETSRMVFTLPSSVLSNSSLQITLQPISNNAGFMNRISVNYCRLTYPQAMNSLASNSKVYYTCGNSTPQITQLAWNTPDPMIFDISNPNQVNLLPFSYNGSQISVVYPEYVDSFLVISRSSLMKPFEITSKQFTLPNITSNYYIISHPLLQTSVQEYADYRSSVQGGNYSVAIEWTTDLYDLFSYGEFTPLALYNYGKYLIANNSEARFISFIGKGVDLVCQQEGNFYRWKPEQFHNAPEEKFKIRNLVPTAGTPGSDLLFVMDQNFHPQIAVGRIPGKNNIEILNYLNKVKEHEADASNSKNLIHLSGGNNLNESDFFSSNLNKYKSIVENSPWQGTVVLSFVNTDFYGPSRVSISNEVNSGTGFITFFGHATESITFPDFGYASVDSNGFQNKGKYPMLILVGCEAGNIYNNYSLVEDWINTPDRGAIAALGGSETMYAGAMDQYTSNLYRHLFDSLENLNKPIGEIINKNLNDPNKAFGEIIQTQIILCGDPALVMNANSELMSIKYKENQESSIRIYPNPSTGVFRIESVIDGRIEILSSHGTLVYADSLQGNSIKVNLNVSPGVYFLRLIVSDKQEWEKLVIGE